ncbi:MAG: glutamine--fructose-6-phosphate transaminase (isomerizing) [Planctomycetota bacterium]|nr:glutamine--fructose-6-phosphate transaminase (isomerizing) [Planctomycetota bacterium]
MCGIVGYTGKGPAVELVVRGLEKLEYRGYDSAGVAFLLGGKLRVVRAVGRVEDLRRKLPPEAAAATSAIGHTRWATHGRPSELNAHPHSDGAGNFAVVHNGIIENYARLREDLQRQGCVFTSETDTEVAAHLISRLHEACGDLPRAVERAIGMIEGTFAFAVLSTHYPGRLAATRRGSPLVAGFGQGEMLVASDALPILPTTHDVYYLKDDQVLDVEPGGARLKGEAVAPSDHIHWSAEEAERGGYEHFMLKEIHEQPAALRKLASKLIEDPGAPGDPGGFPRFRLDEMRVTAEDLRKATRVVVVAQGTSYHAGLIARNMIERTARLPVQVEYGSDFRYRDPIVDPGVLVLGISQSGETADTLGAVRLAKERGCRTVSVLNVQGSTMARESDGCVPMHVGPEIGVASTKAFTGQIAALYVLAIHLGVVRGVLTAPEARRRVDDLLQVPQRIDEALAQAAHVREIALKYKDAEHALYLGRGTGFPLALEGALKLKEVSYIHAEGIDAAEMKHGPIALIDEKMPVFVLALQGRRYEKIVSNIQEVKARGGRVIAIASHDDREIAARVDDVIRVHDDRGIMNSIVCSIPLQLIAYHIAVGLGRDVDKPRNLAKSVTVE